VVFVRFVDLKKTDMNKSIAIPFTNQAYKNYFVALFFLFLLSIGIEKGIDIVWINGNHSPTLDYFFRVYTNVGDGLLLVPVVLALIFVRFQYAVMAVTASTFLGLIISVFKQLLFTNAPRPRAYMNNELIHFVPGVSVHSIHSFPSGHTATAFCLALLIAYAFRNQWVTIITLVCALLVGYSRIYLAQHFLIDVAAGAIIGSFTTFTVCLVFETNVLPSWMYRKIKFPARLFDAQRFKSPRRLSRY
jgi:membrane-associated phospholipid phosphatase